MSNVWSNLIEYISSNYTNSKKIVEVGVGRVLEPSNLLKKSLTSCEIILVDIYPANSSVIIDDITNPTGNIYEKADLIYSIRPPEELQKDVLNLGIKFGCDVIIKPLFTEEICYNLENKFKLVNYKGTPFYIYEDKKWNGKIRV